MPHSLRTDGFNLQQRAFLAIPTYGPMPAEFVHCLWGAQLALNAAGIGATLQILTENCHVDDGRNLLVRDFLDTECTDLIFIDPDVLFKAEDLVSLLLPDEDIVAGIYPLKQTPEKFPVMTLPGDLWSDDSGLVEVMGVPTGFLRIRRNVLVLLSSMADRYHTKGDTALNHPIPIIFERTFVDGNRISGDYSFCNKWRETGGKIYVDPNMELGHLGNYQWHGRLGNYWRRIHGVQEAAFESAVDAVRMGKDCEKDHQALTQHWGNIPYAAGWGLLGRWIDIARNAGGDILEIGAGLTSIMAALANKEQTVYALESDFEWSGKIQAWADKYGADNLKIVNCPLKDGWYDLPSGFIDKKFGAILVDGPSRSQGDRSGFIDVGFDLTDTTVVWDDIDQPVMIMMLNDFCDTHGKESEVIKHISKPFAIAA